MTETNYKKLFERAEKKVEALSWRIKYAADKLPVPSRIKSSLLCEEVKYVINLLREIREQCNLDDIKPKENKIWIEEANWQCSKSILDEASRKKIAPTTNQIQEMWKVYNNFRAFIEKYKELKNDK